MKTHTSKSWIMLALVLLASGAVAWLAVFAYIVLTTEDSADPAGPARAPELVAGVPTLAAVTGAPSVTPIATDTPAATPVPSMASPTLTLTVTPASTSSALPVSSATPLPASTEPSTPASKACPPPDGWERYVVQPDDTLFAFVLGAGGTITVDELVSANCLTSRLLYIDQVLFLPPGAAENAPPSSPIVSGSALMAQGPRTPACPCTISVPEGWRREQIAEAISAAQTMFTGGDFLSVTNPGASAPFDFVMERPAGASLEGFLFPGTYTVQNDTTAEQFRDMQLSAFAANVTPQMRADAAAQGVTFYQALTIASVIQREVRSPDTQKLVASVLYNRYRDGNRLAATVTVQYALGGPGNWWPRVTGEGLKVDSPYNSYTLPGLPPGPIDSPGLSAILAAIYPAQTDFYYHTQACDGSGEAFAVTYEEHLANVNCE